MRMDAYLYWILKVWVDREGTRDVIKHTHYEKPVSSKCVLHSRSALTNEEKRSIFVAEVVRRLRNCHIDMDWATKADYVVEYLERMKIAGHLEVFRREVTKRGVTKYLLS